MEDVVRTRPDFNSLECKLPANYCYLRVQILQTNVSGIRLVLDSRENPGEESGMVREQQGW